MNIRYVALSAAAVTWLLAALLVSIASVSLVAESGLSEMPVLAWVAVAIVFGVALPALLFVGYRWGLRPREA